MNEDYIDIEKKFFEYLSKKYHQKKEITLDSDFLPENASSDEIQINYNDVELFWFIRVPTTDDEAYYYFGLKNPDNNVYLRLFSKFNKIESKSFFKFANGKLAIEIKFMEGKKDIVNSLKKNHITVKDHFDRHHIILGEINKYEIVRNLKNLMGLVEFDLDLNTDCLIIRKFSKNKEELSFPRINMNNVFGPGEIDTSNKVSKSVKEKTTLKQININFKDKNEALTIIKNHYPFENPMEDQLETIIEIINAINDGYKYIVLESGPGKSAIAATLINLYGNSYILTANGQSKNRYLKDFNWKNSNEVFIHDYSEALKLNSLSKFNKRNLLIMDDAHRIDKHIVDYTSHFIQLTEHEKSLIDRSGYDLKKLEDESFSYCEGLLKSFAWNNNGIDEILEEIKEDPENWVWSYNHYRDEIEFELLDVGDFLSESLLNMGDVKILMSATILDIDRFTEELGLTPSKVKFIQKDLPLESAKNKIYARNSFDMKDKYLHENEEFLVEVIHEILDKHKSEKGIIHIKSKHGGFIHRNIEDERLIFHGSGNFESRLEKFKKSENLVLVSDSIDESVEFPKDQCRFQIFLKQPIEMWGARPKRKHYLESHWYDYRTAINIVQKLQRAIRDNDDYCNSYMLDEKFSMFIHNDISVYGVMPEKILESIEDLEISGHEMVTDKINRQFGVYYLYDYLPTGRGWEKIRKNYDTKTKRLSKRIQNYKEYEKVNPKIFAGDFNYFTEELLNALCEFSNEVLNEKITKMALFSVPSSTVERDNASSIRESINVIENLYDARKAENEFSCNKEIINCGDFLKRISDVNISHNPYERRPSYIEHKRSIKCCGDEIFGRDDVAFIILDDITTRGTIMNACEDILIENGANKDRIYKFALAKTVGFYD